MGTIKSFYNNEDVEKTMVTITVKDDKYQELSTTECESNKYWVNADNDCKVHNDKGPDYDCQIKVKMCGKRIKGKVYYNNDDKFISEDQLKEGKAEVWFKKKKEIVTFKPPNFNYLKVRGKQASIYNMLDMSTNLFHRDFIECKHAKQCGNEAVGYGYADCFCTVDGTLIGIPKGATKFKIDVDKKIGKYEETRRETVEKKRRRRGVDESRVRRDAEEGRKQAGLNMSAKYKVQMLKLKLVFSFLQFILQASADSQIPKLNRRVFSNLSNNFNYF